MGANQLAFVAGKTMRTIGADLAMVVDWGVVGILDAGRADRPTL